MLYAISARDFVTKTKLYQTTNSLDFSSSSGHHSPFQCLPSCHSCPSPLLIQITLRYLFLSLLLQRFRRSGFKASPSGKQVLSICHTILSSHMSPSRILDRPALLLGSIHREICTIARWVCSFSTSICAISRLKGEHLLTSSLVQMSRRPAHVRYVGTSSSLRRGVDGKLFF